MDLVVVVEAEADVVGHDGHEVDHAHDGSHELAALGRRVQPQEVLKVNKQLSIKQVVQQKACCEQHGMHVFPLKRNPFN